MRVLTLLLVVLFTLMSMSGCARKSKKAAAAAETAQVETAAVAAAAPATVATGSLMRTFKLVDDQGRESGAIVFNPMGGAELRDIDGTVIGTFVAPGTDAEPEAMKPTEMVDAEAAPAADEMTPEAGGTTDVETEADDESEEDALLEIDGQLAPALAISGEDEEGGFNEERAAAELDEEIAGVVLDFFGEDDGAEAPVVDPDTVSAAEVEDNDGPVAPALFDVGEEPGLEEAPNVNRELALQGVDVERDADDDSDEEPLPFTGQDPAPAFAAEDPEISAEDFTQALEEAGADSEDIAARLDQFFGEEPPAQDMLAEVAPVIIAVSQESEVVFELVDDSVDMLVSFHARVRELVAKPVESIPQHFFEELETLKDAFQKNSSEKELLGIIATLLSMRKDN